MLERSITRLATVINDWMYYGLLIFLLIPEQWRNQLTQSPFSVVEERLMLATALVFLVLPISSYLIKKKASFAQVDIAMLLFLIMILGLIVYVGYGTWVPNSSMVNLFSRVFRTMIFFVWVFQFQTRLIVFKALRCGIKYVHLIWGVNVIYMLILSVLTLINLEFMSSLITYVFVILVLLIDKWDVINNWKFLVKKYR